MATITLLLKANKENSSGEMPVYLRIIEGRKAKFISDFTFQHSFVSSIGFGYGHQLII